jgi:hypothetical protein
LGYGLYSGRRADDAAGGIWIPAPALLGRGVSVMTGAEGVDKGSLATGVVVSWGLGATIPESLGLTGVVMGSVGVKGEVWTGAAEPLAPDSTSVLEVDWISVEGPVWAGAAALLLSTGVETGVVTGVLGSVWAGATAPLSPDTTGVLDTGVATGVTEPFSGTFSGIDAVAGPDSNTVADSTGVVIGVVIGTDTPGVDAETGAETETEGLVPIGREAELM